MRRTGAITDPNLIRRIQECLVPASIKFKIINDDREPGIRFQFIFVHKKEEVARINVFSKYEKPIPEITVPIVPVEVTVYLSRLNTMYGIVGKDFSLTADELAHIKEIIINLHGCWIYYDDGRPSRLAFPLYP